MIGRRRGRDPRRRRHVRQALGRLTANLAWRVQSPLRALRATRERRRLRRLAHAPSLYRRVLSVPVLAIRGVAHGLRSIALWLWRLLSQGDVRYLVQGLPAVLVAGLVGTVAGAAVLSSHTPLMTRYQRAASSALRSEQYRTAELYYERLAQIDGGKPDTRYALAKVAESQQQFDRTRSIMLKLAPKDQKGYAPAHTWLAQYYVDSADGRRDVLREAGPHITQFLASEPDSALAHAVAARYFAGMGQLREAENHLVMSLRLDAPDELKSDLRLSLARLYVLQGNHALARPEAEAAITYYRRRAQTDPGNHSVRLAWAEAALFLELFDEAEQVLQAWQTMDLSDDSQIRSAYINRMSQFYTTKATVFGRQGKAGLVEQLDWIDLALQYNPKNLAAIHGIMALAEKRGTVADEARTKLKEALANGIAPATAHFILGNVAWERGEPDAAREQMEIAYRLNPRMPDVGNNLAWYLADAQSPDLSRALNIINGVLEVDPSHAGYRETRGQILVKLGRWRDALVDLETALPTMRDDRNLHSTLATVYRNLGDTEMASQHERIVLKLSPKE